MSNELLTISLNEPLRAFVLEQAAAAGYPQPGDYISALIDAERRRKAQQELESLLLDGLNSGSCVEADAAYWDEGRRKLNLPPRR